MFSCIPFSLAQSRSEFLGLSRRKINGLAGGLPMISSFTTKIQDISVRLRKARSSSSAIGHQTFKVVFSLVVYYT